MKILDIGGAGDCFFRAVSHPYMSNTPELSRIVWNTQRSDSKEVRPRETEGVKCWRIDSVAHGRTRSVSLFVGSTEQSPIARDLEKYIEVFAEGVKCWRIDSVGHGRTRPFSLCVGSAEQSLIARDLEKYTEVFTEDVKCSQSYSIGHGPSFRVFT